LNELSSSPTIPRKGCPSFESSVIHSTAACDSIDFEPPSWLRAHSCSLARTPFFTATSEHTAQILHLTHIPMISPVLPPIMKACPESKWHAFPLERPFHPMSNDPTRSWQFLSLGSRGERAIYFSKFSNITCNVTSCSCFPTIVSISPHARPVI
jgi:hypothetical protein